MEVASGGPYFENHFVKYYGGCSVHGVGIGTLAGGSLSLADTPVSNASHLGFSTQPVMPPHVVAQGLCLGSLGPSKAVSQGSTIPSLPPWLPLGFFLLFSGTMQERLSVSPTSYLPPCLREHLFAPAGGLQGQADLISVPALPLTACNRRQPS